MGKVTIKAAPVSSYIGKSAAGNSSKGGKLLPNSKNDASSMGSGGVAKPSTTKHGSGFIAKAKVAK